MITFKQYLIENQSYPLFHGTTLHYLNRIIEDNMIRAIGNDAEHGHRQLSGKKTISFTRSRNFADYWSRRVASWADNIEDSVTIEIDRGLLKNNYRILPYNHFQSRTRDSGDRRWLKFSSDAPDHMNLDRNQYEERVIGNIKNASRYITAIHFKDNSLDAFKRRYPKSYDIIRDKGWLK